MSSTASVQNWSHPIHAVLESALAFQYVSETSFKLITVSTLSFLIVTWCSIFYIWHMCHDLFTKFCNCFAVVHNTATKVPRYFGAPLHCAWEKLLKV